MKYQNILKRQTSIILISVILMVLIIIGTSYSLFIQTDEVVQVAESGTLILTSTEGNIISASTVPQSDAEGMNTEGYTFSIENTGTLDCQYTLYISNVASNPLDYQYIKVSIDGGAPMLLTDLDVDPENSSRFIFGAGQLNPVNQGSDSVTHNIKVWVDALAPTDIVGKKIQLQIDLYGQTFESIPSSPELYAGLIPIVYDDDTNAVVANTDEEWYDYDNFEWANAILIDQSNPDIKNKYINADNTFKSGTIVDMADILQMYVWIPRYRYLITDQIVGACGEYPGVNFYDYPECYTINLSAEEQDILANYLFEIKPEASSLTLEEIKEMVANGVESGTINIEGESILFILLFYEYNYDVLRNIMENGTSDLPFIGINTNLSSEEQDLLASFLFESGAYNSIEEAKTAVANAIETGYLNANDTQIPLEYLILMYSFDYAPYMGTDYIGISPIFKPNNNIIINHGDLYFDVIFENKETIKSTGDGTTGYLTHPAFTFGDTELNGIWVGKFESSGTTDNLTIIPNVSSLRSLSVASMFDTSRGIESNPKYGLDSNTIDTHMMKNMEWGAVAYLSQSKYGKFGNPNYSYSNKEVYINNSEEFITGSSGGSPYQSEFYESYEYNDSTKIIYNKDGENNQVIEPTVVNDTNYPWTLTDGIYKSSNQEMLNTTTSLSFNFTLPQMGELSFDWSTSSDYYSYMSFTITKDGEILSLDGTLIKKSGIGHDTEESDLNYTNFSKVLEPGTYTVTFTYKRGNYIYDSYLNAGYVKNFSVKYGATYTKEEVATEENGIGASTTGNIYGIYDMSGGAEEYVMGYMIDKPGVFYPTSLAIDSKYYDLYAYGADSSDDSRGHLGDATKEVGYGNFVYMSSLPRSWFLRGGYYGSGSIFDFDSDTGDASYGSSFRVVLTAE